MHLGKAQSTGIAADQDDAPMVEPTTAPEAAEGKWAPATAEEERAPATAEEAVVVARSRD
jgi:hypothetical protein